MEASQQPDMRPVQESGDIYVLMKPYVFFWGSHWHTIPKGFKSDGATSARLLFQRDGMHRAAALIHDYIYACKGDLNLVQMTRKQADELFRLWLVEAGIKSWHIKAAYLAVRLFGGSYWKE